MPLGREKTDDVARVSTLSTCSGEDTFRLFGPRGFWGVTSLQAGTGHRVFAWHLPGNENDLYIFIIVVYVLFVNICK